MSIDNLLDHVLRPDAVMVLVAVAVLWAVLTCLTWLAGLRRPELDPRRSFTPTQRATIFGLCDHRCEHKHPLWLRCGRPATHADHVYPHARGGPTEVRNGQGLCAFHNLSKSAKIPGPLYVWRLSRRRSFYYPMGVQRKPDWSR